MYKIFKFSIKQFRDSDAWLTWQFIKQSQRKSRHTRQDRTQASFIFLSGSDRRKSVEINLKKEACKTRHSSRGRIEVNSPFPSEPSVTHIFTDGTWPLHVTSQCLTQHGIANSWLLQAAVSFHSSTSFCS